MSHNPEGTSFDALNIPIPHEIIQYMHDLYQGQISDQEAHEAVYNLIGYCRVILEIQLDRAKLPAVA